MVLFHAYHHTVHLILCNCTAIDVTVFSLSGIMWSNMSMEVSRQVIVGQ